MQLVGHDLRHAYPPSADLFANVNFTLGAGAVCALTGPSGSGKSTLLSIVAGWTTPSDGFVRRNGIDQVTWVPQNPVGVARRKTIDHAILPLLITGYSVAAAQERARNVLVAFGLETVSEQPFAALSGGEAQRLMLARAVLCSAQLMLVDEPTAQLDPISAQAVIESLDQVAEQGRIVLIATHDTRVSARCNTVIDLGPS